MSVVAVLTGFAGWMLLFPTGALILSCWTQPREDQFPVDREELLRATSRVAGGSVGLVATSAAARYLARRLRRASEDTACAEGVAAGSLRPERLAQLLGSTVEEAADTLSSVAQRSPWIELDIDERGMLARARGASPFTTDAERRARGTAPSRDAA